MGSARGSNFETLPSQNGSSKLHEILPTFYPSEKLSAIVKIIYFLSAKKKFFPKCAFCPAKDAKMKFVFQHEIFEGTT